MNVGERDEYLIKFKLVQLRDSNSELFGIKLNSVGFNNIEYLSIPSNINFNFKSYSDDQLISFAKTLGITKAKASSKSDVQINGVGYSLKSHSAAPPAIVNHTTRPGFERAAKENNGNIEELDKIIDKYWELRLSGIISEDVSNKDINSPFRNNKEIIEPFLNYFLFKGTGSRLSNHPAELMLDFIDPFDISTWSIENPESVINSYWDSLVFSIRAKKGMPKNYNPNTYKRENANSIKRWVNYHSNDFRGALHIRVKI